MLEDVRAKLKDGVDVVVGIFETHDRKEIEALLRDLEVTPKLRVDYKGRSFEEMDIEAHQRFRQSQSQALSRRR
jgi:two-component system, OmpR family, sensor histidine kinase KdpD